jgi:hypothetical protein
MKRFALHIALALSSQAWCVKASAQYTPGHMIELRGNVFDITNKDTMVFARIKLFSGGEYITGSVADFNGTYLMRFCSNKVKTDSLVIEAEGLGCLKTRMVIKAGTDKTLDIYLPLDPAYVNSPQAKERYLSGRDTGVAYCGTDEQQRLYDANPLFRHCDGRIESFQRLVETNARMEEWDRL